VEERKGFGPFDFVQESIGELKKVEWPNQKAVISGTAVVIIACVIVGLYIWLNDELWKYVVQHVLLR
jgi:preprotein translocase subunit SecE